MSRASFLAFSSTIRFALVALASGIVSQASGCGGQVYEGDGGESGGGETAFGGNSGTGEGSSSSKSDGVGGGGTAGARPTGGRPGTGGISPAGGRPVTGGAPPTGGRTGTGGRPSVGGVAGAGGGPTMDPATLCYAQGGVYFPDGRGCFLGSETTAACVRQAQPISRSCDNKCACRACPSFYSRCLNDGGCRFIATCAQAEQCRGVADCMRTPCSFMIDRAGGRSSIGAVYFDLYSNCMTDYGCSCDVL